MKIEIVITRKHLFILVVLAALVLGVSSAMAKGTPPTDDLEARIVDLEAQVTELESLLVHFSREGNEVYITGANLNIRNGAGSTATANGLGNIIIGYNELRNDGTDNRSGSHMLVVGRRNNFSTYGGIVVGENHLVTGPFASVSGGYGNMATGTNSSISGGAFNYAPGEKSSISGGSNNNAEALQSSINGGSNNIVFNLGGTINGGWFNIVRGNYSSVCGGAYNIAESYFSSIGGGREQITTEDYQFLPE